ncbi:MAG: diadenylate cyclase, partial [Candidatus Kapaibacterium sp.]
TRSPLHDGAVILDGQTVVAARCILPLSNTMKLGSRNLGTRHRAALGLSEVADVVVVVVSEESGSISVAVDGVLQTDIPIASLRETLASNLSVRTTVGGAIQELKKEEQV